MHHALLRAGALRAEETEYDGSPAAILEQVGPLEKLKMKCQIVVRDDMSALSEDFLIPIISEE